MWKLGLPLTVLITGILLAGCATWPQGRPQTLREAKTPAYSLKAMPDEMVVSVSPAGKTLRIAGSSGLVVGATVDAMVNDKYRRAIREALQAYNGSSVVEERLRARLAATLPKGIASVPPLGSSAGLKDATEAEKQRFEKFGKKGTDLLLDVKFTYGIYGAEGTMVVQLDGKATLVPEGKKAWANTIQATDRPLLAGTPFGDPMGSMMPGLAGFSVDDEAVKRWTAEGGKVLRQTFEKAVDDAISALLCDLGLAQEAAGECCLGQLAIQNKEFDEAAARFDRALKLDPASLDAKNGKAVALAYQKKVDEAIAAAKAITESSPQYGPAWRNLAWWYAVDKKDPAAAKPCYDKARALGMPPDSKIEKAIKTGGAG